MSAVTSLLAAYYCYQELITNTRELQVYVFCMNTLSPNQRQLTILTILSFTYIVLGGWIYNYLEDWDLNEATYFIVVVSTSIGFGDLSPKTAFGKIMLIPVALIGLGLVGLNIFAARQVLLEMFTMQLADTFSKKFGMQQEHHAHSVDDTNLTYARHESNSSVVSQTRSFDLPRSSTAPLPHAASSSAPTSFPPLDGAHIPQPPPPPLSRNSSRHRISPSLMRHPSRTMTLSRGGTGFYPKLTLFGDSQIRRRMVVTATKEIVSMQINQAVFLVLTTMLLFASVFSVIEGWSFWDGVYFTFTTVATIGFGDYCPTTPLARSLFIWFVFFGIANVTYLGSMVSERVMNQWIVTVGIIEDRVGRYEVKARIKREWGNCAASGGSSTTDSPVPSPILIGNNEHAPILPVPRILRISSPHHAYGSSLPTKLFQGRGGSSDDEEFSDDDDEEQDTLLGVGPSVFQQGAGSSSCSRPILGQRISTSPANGGVDGQPRSPPTQRSTPSSIRVFSAKTKKRMSRASISENESWLE
ncbi:UNVERIFIED_CONTAM: Potassium channel [Siphonaria sp. JEL0065]|nr:Potassium channel [Siphonaria sp. JEL0065]